MVALRSVICFLHWGCPKRDAAGCLVLLPGGTVAEREEAIEGNALGMDGFLEFNISFINLLITFS